MDKEILNQLREIFREELEPIKTDIKEIKSDIKEFKDQFTDFEGKSASNHVEVINKLENIQKDINRLTNVTKTNCFDIADLKAVK